MKKILAIFAIVCSIAYGSNYDYDRATEELHIESFNSSNRAEVLYKAKKVEIEKGWKLIDLEIGRFVWYGIYIKKKGDE